MPARNGGTRYPIKGIVRAISLRCGFRTFFFPGIRLRRGILQTVTVRGTDFFLPRLLLLLTLTNAAGI